jgi:L-seryl-tRNA(Ser) seleniumtransferase
VTSPYRTLPPVDALVRDLAQRPNGDAAPHEVLVDAARAAIDAARTRIAEGAAPLSADAIMAAAEQHVRAILRPSLRPVLNASGVIIQTNLGRAPLSTAALDAMRTVGAGYSNLEYDLAAGERGSRSSHLVALLRRLTGAEDALAVNNNAAAIYLALSALAAGREVIVSRGQAIEIGGGFRIPDVLRQSGARLVEVGTTNRTYTRDYAGAIGEHTALLMRIHTSNFRLVGFVHETPLAELADLGTERGIAVLDDLGSGTLLPTERYGLAPEPTVQQSVAAGASLVTFSGDKLLGGPQAGLIVGRGALLAQLREHPLARALRVDKTTLAGLEATLLAYVRGTAEQDIPVWRMIAAPVEMLRLRAARIVQALGTAQAELVDSVSAVGGGSLPGETLPSVAVALYHDAPDQLAHRLRQHSAVPVVARIADGRVQLDMRSVLVEQDAQLIESVRQAL